MADYKNQRILIKCFIEYVVHTIYITNTVLVFNLIYSESTKSNVKCFKVESKMAAVKMTRTYAFVQLYPRWPKALSPKKMNIQFPLFIVIVKHVLRNNHYRNTVLVFTREVTPTLKVISATAKVILATNKLVSATEKVI